MKPRMPICLSKKVALAAIATLAALPTLATDYYWYSSASGNWRDASNWSTSSSEYLNAESKFPTSGDNATIATAGLTINIAGGNADVNALTVSTDVTFSGDTTVTLSSNRKTITGRSIVAQTITGTGALTLNNVFLRSNSSALTVDNDVVVSGAAGFYANAYSITMNGDVSGAGLLVLYQYGNDDGTTFYGDNSGFSGEVRFGQRNDYSRDRTKFASTTASFSGAAWYPKSINKYDYNNPHFPNAGTYGIGSLFGWLNVGEGTDGVVLEIGSCNEDCSAQVNMGASTGGHTGYSTIRKVGTGTFEFSLLKSENGTPVIGDLEIAAGTLKVVTNNVYTQVLPNSGHYISFKGTGATLDLPEGTDPSAKIRNSTSAIRVSEGNEDAIWATALDSSNTGGLVKLGSGTLELTATPEYTGATIVSAGTLVIPGGTTLDNLDSIAEGAAVVVNADDGETLTVKSFGEGLSTASITIPVGSSVAWAQDGETGYWVGTITRGALTYTWTDAASGDHNWATPGNWSVGGAAATLPPQAIDSVVFPAEDAPEGGWDVALDADKAVAAVRFNGATALSGALIVCSDVAAASTDVKVTLGNGSGIQENAAALTLAAMSFEVAASVENPARFYMYNNTYKIESTCKITGTGAVTFGVERDSTGLEIKADMTEFAGKATITNARLSANRSNTSITQQASSSNAVWQVNNGSKDKAFFNNGGVTYYFGSLSGSISHNYASVNGSSAGFGYRMEIGNLGLDDTLGGLFFSSTYASRIKDAKYQPILRKVGNGTLTFTGQEVAKYEVNGGVLYCKANTAFETVIDGGNWYTPITFAGEGGTLMLDEAVTLDLSTNFVNSTKAVSIDDGGVDRTWTGVIAASNEGGFTKKGAGTLTLTAVPEYSGMTSVEDGMLVVPQGTTLNLVNALSIGKITGATVTGYAYAAGAEIVVDYASGSVTYDAPLDIANIASIDASGVTLTKGQPYVIASATTITGYTKSTLASVALTLPDGVDASKWVIKVLTIGNVRCLCVAPATNPFKVILR